VAYPFFSGDDGWTTEKPGPEMREPYKLKLAQAVDVLTKVCLHRDTFDALHLSILYTLVCVGVAL